MGITFKQYLENIFNLLFSPFEFFDDENVKVSVRQAVGNVLFITVLCFITKSAANYTLFDNFLFPLALIAHTVWILVAWFFTGLFFEYLYKIYFDESKLSEILFYTSYAMLPYVFFAPLDILKHSNDFGKYLGITIEILLYFWIICLYIFALKKVYKVTFARAFMIILLPFISTVFATLWTISFIFKLGYINSI